MQVKASVTFETFFDVPEGITIEEVRAEALGRLHEALASDEEGTSLEDQVGASIQNSLYIGQARRASMEVRISEDK